jgi:hypothetical protein
MRVDGLSFSIAAHAAWAPGIETPEAWLSWAKQPFAITGDSEPGVKQMPPMLRRRAGMLGKMALEVAYQCLDERKDVTAIFCSRHGEVARAYELLVDLANDVALSPTAFGLAVHNASAGLLSIARTDQANHLAMAAGASTVEHGVIEACGLLADGAPMVLLVAYDNCLPAVFEKFQDCKEQPHAWAWLMVPADKDRKETIRLSWSPEYEQIVDIHAMPPSLQILQFQLGEVLCMERVADGRRWRWARDA